MGLSRYKLGELIEQCDVRNDELKYTLEDVKGISIQKIFIETKADMKDVSLTPYKLVRPDNFAYVTVTSRNGEKITLAHNTTVNTYIVSSSYIVFKVNRTDLLSSDFLYIYFNRPEFDRYSRFNSWGSARETFSWEDMCDMDIDLPPLAIQQKYVNVYNAMVANQKAYERGVEDLKLTCDAYIEDLSTCDWHKIGNYIKRNRKRNQEKKFTKAGVKGFNNDGLFIEPMRLFSGDISTFKIITKNDFVYNSRINSTIKKLSIVINEAEDVIVSPAYESFYIEKDKELLYPFYLYMLLQRESFARKVLFNSFGSSTIVFGFDDLSEIEIPIPSFSEQVAIANLYKVYKERWSINEKLKAQIKSICPILIKGSIEEGRNTKEA
ncbi:restriction endonuclease subunit S [uncultured Megasphaera sp.]|uniref:restriction endonuclease subunit S n=1 Tax=uncultured Megasphaera sp. TaxID=165188 RepID=UPI0025920849|nr:restriction endonuclease subunit S [uncultured Megasphaera sp.]